MLTDSVEKRNEDTAIQTGLPLRPVMFDSILKTFTPDITDNLSGRPRFVHYAFFVLPSFCLSIVSYAAVLLDFIMVNMGALLSRDVILWSWVSLKLIE